MYISLTVKMWYFICILYVYCVAVHVASDNVKINENTTTITTTTDLGTTRKKYKHSNIATNVQWGWGAGGVVDFLPTACTEVWLAHAGCALRRPRLLPVWYECIHERLRRCYIFWELGIGHFRLDIWLYSRVTTPPRSLKVSGNIDSR